MRTGSRCTTLTKLPVAFSGGRSAVAAPVPAPKPEMRPAVDPARVGVGADLDLLADRQVADLGLLEVGVDPDVLERPQGHQPLPRLHAVAGVGDPAADEPGDLGMDLRVAEVEPGLLERVARLLQAGSRKLHRRRRGDELVQVLVQVAAGCVLLEVRVDRVGILVDRRDLEADLHGHVDQLGQRRADGRRLLGPVGGDVVEGLPGGGHGDQPQRRAGEVDLLVGLELGGGRDLVGRVALVDHLLGPAVGLEQVPGPAELGLGQHALGAGLLQGRQAGLQLGDPFDDMVDGQLQVVVGRPDPRHDGPALGLGLEDLGLRHGDRRGGSSRRQSGRARDRSRPGAGPG